MFIQTLLEKFCLELSILHHGGNQLQLKISLQFCRQRRCLIQIRAAQNGVGQNRKLDKTNFQPYKKPLSSGPSSPIIRPAVISVKKLRRFQRFRRRLPHHKAPEWLYIANYGKVYCTSAKRSRALLQKKFISGKPLQTN